MGSAAKITAWFLPLLMVVFSLSSCEKLGDDVNETKVKIPIKKSVFNLDSLANGERDNELLLHQWLVDIDVDSVLEAQGLDHISSARANEMVLGIYKPASEDLYFLSDAKITISGDEDFEDEIKIAQIHNINGQDHAVRLEIIGTDVTQEFTNRGFFLRIYATPAINTLDFVDEVKMFVEGQVSLEMDK